MSKEYPMIKKRKPYKTYTKEFKLEAIRLVENSDRPASEIANELGIRRNQIYKWKEQLEKRGEAAFGGRGRPRKGSESDTAKLRAENKRLKEENAILKKAAVFFAKELD